MNSVLQALMWLGLGMGIGGFAGDRIGYNRGKKEGLAKAECIAKFHEPKEDTVESWTVAAEHLDTYRGGDIDGDDFSTVEGLNQILKEPATDEDDPDMPMDVPMIDEDIPQLHPTHLTPEIIGEEEFNANIDQFDLESLIYYEGDEVLYNERTDMIIENPEDVIGIGTLYEFHAGPDAPKDTIYVKNREFGTYFRIDRVDAAFDDVVAGHGAPTDEDEPDDPEEQEDYWDDV